MTSTQPKNTFPQKLVSVLFQASLFTLVLCTVMAYKYPLNSDFAFAAGEYKDFTIVLLYTSDLALLGTCLLGLLVKRKSGQFRDKYALTLVSLLSVVATASLIFSLTYGKNGAIPLLAVYASYNIFKALLLFTILIKIKARIIPVIKWATAASSIILFITTTLQFQQQTSLGLKYLGESVLNKGDFGTSTFWSSGMEFLRSYATLPHPNVLGGIAGLFGIILFSFSITSANKLEKIVLFTTSCMSTAIVFFSFSRAALLSYFLSTLAIYSVLVYKKLTNKAKTDILAGFLLNLFVLLTIFTPFLIARSTSSFQSNYERENLYNIGFQLVLSKPLLGYGPGQSVLHMEQYLENSSRYWEIQPIHNYFLAAGAEVSLLYSFLVFLLLLAIFAKLIKRTRQRFSSDNDQILVVGMLGVLLFTFINMQLDHYFYTLTPGIIVFWLVLALSYRVACEAE